MTINSIEIIYIGIILCILLYIFKCIHACVRGYKLVLKYFLGVELAKMKLDEFVENVMILDINKESKDDTCSHSHD